MKPSDLVKVKALEWKREDYGTLGVQDTAVAINCLYYVWSTESGYTSEVWVRRDDDFEEIAGGDYPTEADAKAACQAHYESMIYELLEVSDE